MARIFVSYRREDTTGFAGRIKDELERRFPEVALTPGATVLIPAGLDGAVADLGAGTSLLQVTPPSPVW